MDRPQHGAEVQAVACTIVRPRVRFRDAANDEVRGGQHGVMMAEETEVCPFCMTPIPQGAVVCRGCGANKGINQGWMPAILLVGAFYLFWGPFVGLVGLTHLGTDDMATVAAVMGVAVTVGGFFLLRAMFRQMAKPVWRRHVA